MRTKWDPVLREMADEGTSLSEVARRYGVTRQNIQQQLAKHPDLYDAWKLLRAERAREQKRERERARGAARERERRRRRLTGNKPKGRWTKDDFVVMVRQAAEELGEPLSSLQMTNWLAARPDLPSYTQIGHQTGWSWRELCERAGVQGVKPPNRRYGRTREDCEAALRRVASQLDVIPTWAEYDHYHRLPEPSVMTVMRRFNGSWPEVVRWLEGEGFSV